MNAENRMITKVNNDNFYSIPNDTIKYFYQGNLLIRTEYHRYRMYKKSLIYYNAQKNVDSIVTITPTNYNGHLPIFDPTNKMRTVEQFENYDTSQNPMKQFGIFEETFHRSLSKNNYRKYTSTQYDSNGTNNGYDTKEWEFIYQNGQVNFSL